MYFRQILRAQLYGTRTARLARLRPVFRAEVAALKTNRLVLILINIFFSLTAAEHVDNCPARPGGGCRKPAVPHHQEVWLIVPHHISCFCYVLCECWQQLSAQKFYFPLHISVPLIHRDHCAPRVTRWGWQRRLARSMATQLQPSSPKWLTKASLQTLFMKTRR